MSAKMGRPLSDNPRNHKLFVRLTDKENDDLERCCEITEKSKAELVREGMKLITDKILERE
ncbi:hypothetical protein [Coprococcus sp. RTP21281st1_F1_RTP21281_210402]|uniref:hypothetical protein n=1 Tax=Coprococcus sp. RTP21281st1_F1_RTP21281_210402 TaxID=3143208 RepID=UPI0034A2B77C